MNGICSGLFLLLSLFLLSLPSRSGTKITYCNVGNERYDQVMGEVREITPNMQGLTVTIVNAGEPECPLRLSLNKRIVPFKVGDVISVSGTGNAFGLGDIKNIKVNPAEGTRLNGDPSYQQRVVHMNMYDAVYYDGYYIVDGLKIPKSQWYKFDGVRRDYRLTYEGDGNVVSVETP